MVAVARTHEEARGLTARSPFTNTGNKENYIVGDPDTIVERLTEYTYPGKTWRHCLWKHDSSYRELGLGGYDRKKASNRPKVKLRIANLNRTPHLGEPATMLEQA